MVAQLMRLCFVSLTVTNRQGKELIARVHLQMQLGKRRIELEAKFEERTREIQLLSDLSPVGISRFAFYEFSSAFHLLTLNSRVDANRRLVLCFCCSRLRLIIVNLVSSTVSSSIGSIVYVSNGCLSESAMVRDEWT